MIRKLILNFHMYGGLLCFGYLIIFGVSSLVFNHKSLAPERSETTVSWERSGPLPQFVPVRTGLSGRERDELNKRNDEAVRAALELPGWPVYWESQWSQAPYKSVISRPGKRYVVAVDVDHQRLQVRETRAGIFEIMTALHGFTTMPGSAFVSTWRFYTDLCTLVVLFAACSGVYLWTKRRSERRIGLLLLGGAGAVSVGLMLFVTLHG